MATGQLFIHPQEADIFLKLEVAGLEMACTEGSGNLHTSC